MIYPQPGPTPNNKPKTGTGYPPPLVPPGIFQPSSGVTPPTPVGVPPGPIPLITPTPQRNNLPPPLPFDSWRNPLGSPFPASGIGQNDPSQPMQPPQTTMPTLNNAAQGIPPWVQHMQRLRHAQRIMPGGGPGPTWQPPGYGS
jgi:hypothetical protein